MFLYQLKRNVLLIDPTVEWLSLKHLVYLLLALIPFIFLVLIPSLLLCVYPTRIYQCLVCCLSARKQLAITAFAEALHSCFKDGLNGTRDYRALAGCMIMIQVVYGFVGNAIEHVVIGYTKRVVIGLTLIFSSLVISYVRPCKLRITNLSFSYHLMVFGILYIINHLWIYDSDRSTGTKAFEVTFIIVPAISHILMLVWFGYTLTYRIIKYC